MSFRASANNLDFPPVLADTCGVQLNSGFRKVSAFSKEAWRRISLSQVFPNGGKRTGTTHLLTDLTEDRMKRTWLFSLSAVLLALFTFNATPQRSAQPIGPVSAEPAKLEEFEPEEPLAKAAMDGLITLTTYPMTVGTDTLVDMSSGTTQLVAPSADDTASPLTDIGFDFFFDGVRHSQFSVNPNGLAKLGGPVITTAFNNATGFAVTTNAPKLAPYFDDLCVGSDGEVRYKVIGAAPNRTLVVEWFNMKITRSGSCGQAGNGSFQMWLQETTGKIEFVYGELPAAAAGDSGYTVGIQSGAATNFASVSTLAGTVSYDTHNSTQTDAIPAGKKFTFTPVVPAAPTNVSFSGVTAIAMTVNWTDNSSDEAGFAVYRSTDGVNFAFAGTVAANTTSFADSGLTPNTNYTYRVFSFSEGAVSTAASGIQATAPTGIRTPIAGGGAWSSPATWVGGQVPTSSDVVFINSASPVTIDTDAQAYAVNVGFAPALKDEAGERNEVGGSVVLVFDQAAARTLTVVTDVTVGPAGTLTTPNAGTVTTHVLSIGRSLSNHGVLNFSTNGNTAGAGIVFTGANNATFSGPGFTNVRTITVNKGTSRDNILELSTGSFTVQSASTDSATANYLTITNGTFKVSGTFTADLRTFPTAAYTIPSTGGFWLNNPNYTVTGQNGSPTVAGLLRLTQGIFNVGTSSGNSMGGSTGASYLIEGGTLNTAGRLQTTSAVNYTQSGGAVNVCTVANTATSACFGLTNGSNVFNMTGGTITLVTPSGSATPLDYSVSTSATFVANPAGTVLNVGTGAGAAAYRVLGATPNLNIPADKTMHVGSGTAGGAIFFRGATIVNDGVIAVQGTGASSRFDFAASGPMTYGGTGTFGTAATPFVGVGISANSPSGDNATFNAPVFVNRANFFNGGFANSNQLTFGAGGTTTTVIQVGNSSTPTNAGGFDVQPNYNTGSGGHIVLHLRSTTLNRPTSFEIHPSRSLTQLTVDNNAVGASVIIAGGDITVAGALTLTNGLVDTNGSTLIHNGTATRTGGSVEGRLGRSYTAAGAYTYHVSKNGYSPVLANVTAGTFPASLTVEAFDSLLGGYDPAKTVSRNWDVQETGDLTADLSFTYLDEDVNGTEADYRVYRRSNGVSTNMCAAAPCVNEATNTGGPVIGVTDYSRWTVGENQTPAPATIAVSGRVFRSPENPLGNAFVTISGGNLAEPITVVTPPFGYFAFDGIPAAGSYTITVTRKGFTFAQAVISGEEDISGIELLAEQF